MPLTLKMEMNLTDDDLAVIEHVVTDHPNKQPGERVGEAWAKHAWNTLGVNGPAAVVAKIQKYRAAYEASKSAEGAAYKNASQREADAISQKALVDNA